MCHCSDAVERQGVRHMGGYLAEAILWHLHRRRVASDHNTILGAWMPARICLTVLCMMFMAIPWWPGQWGSMPPARAATSGPSTFADHLHAKFQHPRCLNCHHFN